LLLYCFTAALLLRIPDKDFFFLRGGGGKEAQNTKESEELRLIYCCFTVFTAGLLLVYCCGIPDQDCVLCSAYFLALLQLYCWFTAGLLLLNTRSRLCVVVVSRAQRLIYCCFTVFTAALLLVYCFGIPDQDCVL
jgi:cell division protein FtsW (lipid II flippase)